MTGIRSYSVFSPAPEFPIGPAAGKSIYARALHRACLIVGSGRALAGHLGVSEADLARWLDGTQEPPYEVFLAAVEVILLSLDAPGRAN